MRIPLRLTLVLLIACLALPVFSARADGLSYAAMTPPDTSKFPTITSYLDAFDDHGTFISNLGTGDVSVLENGELIKPDSLEKLVTPLNFVLAVNSDPALGNRDGQGRSRFVKLQTILDAWTSSLPANSEDKMGLVWNGGAVASHLTPGDWKTRLDAFDPATTKSVSSNFALSYALDASQEAQLGPGSKRAILLISPHLSIKDQAGLDDLTTRAKQSGVRIFVWIVDSQAYMSNPGALALVKLAEATGGSFATFTGGETLPDLESWVSTLRAVYLVRYSSLIRAPGQNSVRLQVNSGSLALSTPAASFQLDIQPPSAVLLSPPITLVRQNPEAPFNIESFTPADQQISILVEFPDGRVRSLKRTTLFVDGTKTAENTAEPFTRFNWNLRTYVASGEHSLKVEVEDSLGLSQMSNSVPVQVTVVQPPGGMAGLILRNSTAITITFLVLAGSVVLGIIILGGRRGLASLSERRKSQNKQVDPVTQPVHVEVEAANTGRANPFPWLRRREPPAPAYLARLAADGLPLAGADPISLPGREITFGTDPTQATVVLDHPSLSLLHARLRREPDGSYLLLDQNSVAGTWINYTLVPREGQTLQHGDMINFGSLTYRFVLAKAPAPRKPTITPIQDNDTH